jgi:hypothetical protein
MVAADGGYVIYTSDVERVAALGVGGVVALALQLFLSRRPRRLSALPARAAGAVVAVVLCVAILAQGGDAS